MSTYSPKRAHFARLTTASSQYDPSAKYRLRSIWRWLKPRRARRKVTILLSIMATALFITRWMRRPDYDWQFLEDESEEILGTPTKFGHQQPGAMAPESFPDGYDSRRQARAIKKVIEPMARGRDGLTRVGDWVGRHPLFEITQRAEDDFRKESASRPATLADAYHAYVKERGRRPPASYPSFFERLPPTCPPPSITPFNLYSPLSAPFLRKRQTGLEGSPGTVTLGIRNGRVGVGLVKSDTEVDVLRDAAKKLVDILGEIAPDLPDLRFTLSPTRPRNPIPFRLRRDMEDLRRIGETFDEDSGDWDEDGDGDGIYGFRGWLDACTRASVLAGGDTIPEDPKKPHRFIHSATPLSPCDHPSLLNQSDLYAMRPPSVGILTPLFSYSRSVIHGDILLPRPQKLHPAPTTPWDQRIPKLYWRGVAGEVEVDEELACPTNRLIYLVTRGSSHPAQRPVLVPQGSGFTQSTRKIGETLAELTDVAFSGCDWDYDCADMVERYRFDTRSNSTDLSAEPVPVPGDEKWSAFKYVLDVDSHHGPSTHFRDLLLSGSLVLRSSVYEDYWTAQARPWVHYVPVQSDFSDLASILLFFREHDELAMKIALSGQGLARECFGQAGVEAGLLLTLGEYGRMWNMERKGADMEAP